MTMYEDLRQKVAEAVNSRIHVNPDQVFGESHHIADAALAVVGPELDKLLADERAASLGYQNLVEIYDDTRTARDAALGEVEKLRARLSEVQQQLQHARNIYIDDAKTRFVNDREGHYREHELDEVDAAAGAEFDRRTSPVVDDKDGQRQTQPSPYTTTEESSRD